MTVKFDDVAPQFPHVDEDDEEALRDEHRRLINALGAVEEALREKHGMNVATV